MRVTVCLTGFAFTFSRRDHPTPQKYKSKNTGNSPLDRQQMEAGGFPQAGPPKPPVAKRLSRSQRRSERSSTTSRKAQPTSSPEKGGASAAAFRACVCVCVCCCCCRICALYTEDWGGEHVLMLCRIRYTSCACLIHSFIRAAFVAVGWLIACLLYGSLAQGRLAGWISTWVGRWVWLSWLVDRSSGWWLCISAGILTECCALQTRSANNGNSSVPVLPSPHWRKSELRGKRTDKK